MIRPLSSCTDGKQAGAKSTWPAGVRYRWGNLLSDDVSEFHGLRVTDVSRTLRDIAACTGCWREWFPSMPPERSGRARPGSTFTEAAAGAQFAVKAGSGRPLTLGTQFWQPFGSKARYLILKADLAGIQTFELQARSVVGPEENYSWTSSSMTGVVELDGKFKLDGTPSANR